MKTDFCDHLTAHVVHNQETDVVPNLILFTDASVDAKTHNGFGAYLLIETHLSLDAYLAIDDLHLSLVDLKAAVKLKKFEHTSSTKVELQTLLWALDEILSSTIKKTIGLVIYCDSQNTLSLLARRNRLESLRYYANNGVRLKNADIYQQFYKLIDQLDCKIIKVDGHKPQQEKNDIDKIFALVDKASRSALRNFIYKTFYSA